MNIALLRIYLTTFFLVLISVLFVNNTPQAEIKLIDFGLSTKFGHEELTDGVGTMYVLYERTR